VRKMKGIPAKCEHCGKILVYDGAKGIYYCPDCDATKPEVPKKAA
jgi:ribosomal protein L37AE/L43A